MPIQHSYLDGGLGLLLMCDGTITGKDLIQFNEYALALVQAKKNVSSYCIVDYSPATTFDVSTPEIEILAAQDKKLAEYIDDYVVALIAKRDLEYGISRMWETVLQTSGLQWETMVFRERNDAESWLREIFAEKHNKHLTFA